VPRRRPKIAALTAVLALLLAGPFQRGRDCDVCPVDCPMHAAKPAAQRVGCHHGGADAPPRLAPADDGACAMRASCGHHTTAVPGVLHLALPPALVVAPFVSRPLVALASCDPQVADAPAPPDHPPKPSVV
jgi:hypothetical protein